MPRLIADKYREYQKVTLDRFAQLKANEEELNRIFIDIYGLQGELTPDVADKDVTVYRIIDQPNEEERKMAYVLSMRDEIVSLLSYMVGCIMGRYSLDADGLILADQGANLDDYLKRIPHPTFMPDDDAIIPITDEDYFGDDDIVAHVVQFVRVCYGEETLEQNLQFIADALGGRGTARDVIRQYFLKEFYADHCRTYKKRPIYWLFDSGRKNGFKALTYLHRYTPDLLARLRTDYVHEQQERYRTQIENVEAALDSAEKGRRVALQKRLRKLQDQLKETSAYEEKVHHLADQMIAIDLDDGVKVNYAKFQDVLAKIK